MLSRVTFLAVVLTKSEPLSPSARSQWATVLMEMIFRTGCELISRTTGHKRQSCQNQALCWQCTWMQLKPHVHRAGTRAIQPSRTHPIHLKRQIQGLEGVQQLGCFALHLAYLGSIPGIPIWFPSFSCLESFHISVIELNHTLFDCCQYFLFQLRKHPNKTQDSSSCKLTDSKGLGRSRWMCTNYVLRMTTKLSEE